MEFFVPSSETLFSNIAIKVNFLSLFFIKGLFFNGSAFQRTLKNSNVLVS